MVRLPPEYLAPSYNIIGIKNCLASSARLFWNDTLKNQTVIPDFNDALRHIN